MFKKCKFLFLRPLCDTARNSIILDIINSVFMGLIPRLYLRIPRTRNEPKGVVRRILSNSEILDFQSADGIR